MDVNKYSVADWLDSLPEELADEVMAVDPKKMKYLVGLNPSQTKAVMTVEGSVQINAVAGSGKTRVLVNRIAYMLASGIKANNILVTTFTKKAAEEMKNRLIPIIPKMALTTMTIGTTHSIGFRILAKEYDNLGNPLAKAFKKKNGVLFNGFHKIFGDNVKKAIISDRTVPFEVKQEVRDIPTPTFLKVVGNAKNKGMDEMEFQAQEGSGAKFEAYCEFYSRYEAMKRAECVVDGDDLLFLLWKLFREHTDILDRYRKIYKYLLVDEAQDNNGLQYELFKMLSFPENNLFVVGDDDQSMYSFRGARPDQFINFSVNYKGTKQIALEDNYRSNPKILEVANNLIRNNTVRLIKSLKANKVSDADCVGFTKYADEQEEAKNTIQDIKTKIEQDGKSPKSITILYRTNAQSRVLEDELIVAGLPYVIHGGISFYERKEIKDLVAYMQLAIDDSNDKAFSRVINVPSRYLGKAFMEKVKAYNGTHYEAICGGINMKDYEVRGTKEFRDIIVKMSTMIADGATPVDVLDFMMDKFYAEYLREQGEDEDEGSSRFENIDTLRYALERYENVKDFLDYIDMMSSTAKHSIDGVQLMTIHKSKGLEFDTAYVVGLSQGILPHFRAIESAQNGKPLSIEEERRLLYVAITRAESECYMSSCGMFNGKPAPTSQFVPELGLALNKTEPIELEELNEEVI